MSYLYVYTWHSSALSCAQLHDLNQNERARGLAYIVQVSNSLVLSAPDRKSMDMWKVALQPVLSPCYMKYRTRRPLTQPEPEQSMQLRASKSSPKLSVSAAAPAAAASETGTKAAPPPAVEGKGQDVKETAVLQQDDEDKVLLRRFYGEHPAGRGASSGWDGVDRCAHSFRM